MPVPHYQILTIFPEIFDSFLSTSLIRKSIESGRLRCSITNIRDFAASPHFKTDDTPYGGGAGMVMRPEPLCGAIEQAKKNSPGAKVLLMTPSGTPFRQKKAAELSAAGDLIFVCGRYEGVDQRLVELFVDEEISIGDFVLMGGEIPAMAVVESIVRLQDEVLGNADSIKEESFSIESAAGVLLEAPHYTKPAEFRGLKVPEELLSGNHKLIREWRLKKALEKTEKVRPDLLLAEKSTRNAK